jgi:hypothetical protein
MHSSRWQSSDRAIAGSVAVLQGAERVAQPLAASGLRFPQFPVQQALWPPSHIALRDFLFKNPS